MHFSHIYIEKVKQELLKHKPKLKNKVISSIYIGGGTPSLIDAKDIESLLKFIYENCSLQKNIEITLEANPDSVTFDKLQIWKNAGINRISIGLQSLDDEMLKLLGRVHTFGQYEKAMKLVKEAGFTNISTDILLGLPNESKQSIKQTISEISKMGLTHISAYGLQVENGTKLFDDVQSGKIKLPTEEQAVEIYNTAVATLAKLGYKRYEISNFCKSGYKSKHNQNYWNRGEYLGLGTGAYSFIDGEHYENTTSLEDYLNKPYRRKNIEKENLKTKIEETIMLALRTEVGLDLQKFKKDFSIDFEKEFETQIAKFKSKKLIKIVKNHLKITNFEISNQIIADFF